MAKLELIIPYGNFPNQLKYTNDDGVYNSNPTGFSSDSADASTNTLSPRVRYFAVNTLTAIDFLNNTPTTEANPLTDETLGSIHIAPSDLRSDLFLTNQTFATFKQIKAFILGADNVKDIATIELA